ncbi:MAG: class I SAM-dependent methyltransferase [Pyrinomonadaceae bacterium]
MNENIVTYYDRRAREYEKVYHNPAEQDDLRRAEAFFKSIFAGKRVLEVACGTGYWTERLAKTAESIYATDINASVIEIALERKIDGTVIFAVADMFEIDAENKFDAVFCGFIWSHILLEDLDRFLKKLQDLTKPAGHIVFIDGNPVPGSSHDPKNIIKTDKQGNTYQDRILADGSAHRVLKNFPTDDFLTQKLETIATKIEVKRLKWYWIATCVNL